MSNIFFLGFMVAEVMALVTAFALMGFFSTLGLIFLGIIVGGWLLRWQGLSTAQNFVLRVEQGQPPMAEAWDGVCIIIAAILLIIPGLVSDALALLLLIPVVRKLLYVALVKSNLFKGHYWFAQTPRTASAYAHLNSTSAQFEVVDAVYEEVVEDNHAPHSKV